MWLHQLHQNILRNLICYPKNSMVNREPKKGGDRGGGEEGRSGGRVNRAWGGKREEKWGKTVGGKGPESTLEKLWFWYTPILTTQMNVLTKVVTASFKPNKMNDSNANWQHTHPHVLLKSSSTYWSSYPCLLCPTCAKYQSNVDTSMRKCRNTNCDKHQNIMWALFLKPRAITSLASQTPLIN